MKTIHPATKKYPEAVSVDPITVKAEINRRLNLIRRYVKVNDHEAAHWERDKLLLYVICAVAQQRYCDSEILSDYAELALLSERIEFKKWCA